MRMQFAFTVCQFICRGFLPVVMLCFCAIVSRAQAPYPDKEMPGEAFLSQRDGEIALQNRVIALSVKIDQSKICAVEVWNRLDSVKFRFAADQLFRFVRSKRDVVDLSNLQLQGVPEYVSTEEGKQVRFSLSNSISDLSVEWKLVLDNDKNFIRQFLEINSSDTIAEFVALPISSGLNPTVMGAVDGSPVVAGNLFWAIENPFFVVRNEEGKSELSLIPINKKSGVSGPNVYKEVVAIGAFAQDQLRRSFQFYLDEIRVKPYRPIAFYDSWYDLSYDLNLLSEKDCIDRVKVYGDSLQKRGVGLNTFLWDSGWDDWHNMWNFNPQLKD